MDPVSSTVIFQDTESVFLKYPLFILTAYSLRKVRKNSSLQSTPPIKD